MSFPESSSNTTHLSLTKEQCEQLFVMMNSSMNSTAVEDGNNVPVATDPLGDYQVNMEGISLSSHSLQPGLKTQVPQIR